MLLLWTAGGISFCIFFLSLKDGGWCLFIETQMCHSRPFSCKVVLRMAGVCLFLVVRLYHLEGRLFGYFDNALQMKLGSILGQQISESTSKIIDKQTAND